MTRTQPKFDGNGLHMIGVRLTPELLKKVNDLVGNEKLFPSWSHMVRTALLEYFKTHGQSQETKS